MEEERKMENGFLVVQGDKILFADENATQLTGRTEAELLGADAQAATAGLDVMQIPLSQGHTLWILDTVDGFLQRREKEDAQKRRLEEALQAARSANEAKSSFLSNMSHDIRTPMNAIVGMTSIALTHIDEKLRVQDCLGKIQTASTHLMGLVNDVLDMSRIDSGKMAINEDVFSLADLVHDVVVITRPLAQDKRQQFQVVLQDVTYEKLIGDALHLRQVFVNILNNAVKYTQEEGNIVLELSEHPGDNPRETVMRFRCRDNGTGMSQEFLERIFLPFERVNNSTVSKVEGTGLGMAITKRLVEQMKGEISVTSQLGKGSCFTVDIPMMIADESSAQLELLKGRTVLVLDDQQERREQLSSILEAGGMKCVAKDNGIDAVMWLTEAQYEDQPPCAMIVGESLTFMTMLDVVAHVRSLTGKDFPIILVSEGDWEQMEYRAVRAGVDAFVPCPLFRSRLLGALCELTDRGSAREREHMDKDNYENKHVLLVEDNELNQEIAYELISSIGVQVEVASDGQEAVDRFAASEPGYYDIIFMDIQMPVMDGYEATRQIRKLDRPDAEQIWIVAMTANAFVEDIKRSREAGMNEHCAKPIDLERLEEILRRRLHQ
jgi:signal transduction histidine kinase/DNA-binding response OmpR family regulator